MQNNVKRVRRASVRLAYAGKIKCDEKMKQKLRNSFEEEVKKEIS